MEWVETTGRTVEEAQEAALDQLGVDAQDAEFEIVEEPRFGLFGRLRSEARVRARVRPTKPRPKEERRDRRGRRRVAGAGAEGAPAMTDDDSDVPTSPRAPGRRPKESEPSATGDERSRSRPAGTTTAPARSAGSSNGDARGSDDDASGSDDDRDGERRPPGNRGVNAGGGRKRRPTARSEPDRDPRGAGEDEEAAPIGRRAPRPRSGRSNDGGRRPPDDPTTSPGGGMEVSLDEQGMVARDFLDGLAELMSLDADIVISQPEEETVELNLQGDDLGLLIGPKGTTLLALQDLTRTVVQRKTSAGNGRILVDVSGYRRKRKDALARFSRQVAEEVQASGTRRVLEPMSAADRKIVHDTVNDIEGVITVSEGEDPRRRVVILPEPTGN
jgi:spoIIIJ-associated protein